MSASSCQKRQVPNQKNCRRNIRYLTVLFDSKILMVLLIAFVAVAAMQAIQLNDMLSDAVTIGKDITLLRTEQASLYDSYVFSSNNLSYVLHH